MLSSCYFPFLKNESRVMSHLLRNTLCLGCLWLCGVFNFLPAQITAGLRENRANAKSFYVYSAMPGAPSPAASEWSFEIDISGHTGMAYNCVKISATNLLGPVKTDRTLSFHFSREPGGAGYTNPQMATYVTKLVVPENGITATLFAPVPLDTGHTYEVECQENGKPIDVFYVFDNLTPTNTNRSRRMSSGLPRIAAEVAGERLFYKNVLLLSDTIPLNSTWQKRFNIGAKAYAPFRTQNIPDMRNCYKALHFKSDELQADFYASVVHYTENSGVALGHPTDEVLLTARDEDPGFQFSQLSEFSDNWLALSNTDITMLSTENFAWLQKNRPEAWEALLRWTTTGGKLLIYNVGKEWSAVDSINAACGIKNKNSDLLQGWKTPEKVVLPEIHDHETLMPFYFDSEYYSPDLSRIDFTPAGKPRMYIGGEQLEEQASSGEQWDENRKAFLKAHSPFQVRSRPFGMGHIILLADENPFPGATFRWAQLWHHFDRDKLNWAQRHGIWPEKNIATNLDFFRFLVPGIGQTPVISFLSLITLFMILVGPINYIVLSRQKRIPWILVSVPLASGLFILGLFLFAFFGDGFTTRARLKSVTTLANGRAACMSRQTYFTAFAPSQGMLYPKDTAVYTLAYPQHIKRNTEKLNIDFVVQDKSTQLRGPLLAPREQRQFVTMRSAACVAELKIAEQPDTEKIVVTNALGATVKTGIIIGTQGNFYVVKDLAAGDTTTIAPTSSESKVEMLKFWQTELHANDLDFPPSFNTRDFERSEPDQNSYRSQVARKTRPVNPNANEKPTLMPTQSTSLLEKQYSDAGRIIALINPTNNSSDATNQKVQIPDRDYFMLMTAPLLDTDGQSFCPLGITANVTQSSHLVRGTW
jgi:hypothetical protein